MVSASNSKCPSDRISSGVCHIRASSSATPKKIEIERVQRRRFTVNSFARAFHAEVGFRMSLLFLGFAQRVEYNGLNGFCYESVSFDCRVAEILEKCVPVLSQSAWVALTCF